MLYSKNGSIPKPETDGTEGWIEVPDEPVAPEGKEVVWWYPPGWVIRDPMPVKAGFKYNWSQSELKWVESEDPQAVVTETVIDATTQNETVTITDVVLDVTDTSSGLDITGLASAEVPSEVVVEVPVAEVTIDVGTASATPTI